MAALVYGDSPQAIEAQPGAAAKRPNIVLILVDDAAFMDFGAFGGEARTPNIDRLAARGAMLTNYHTSPLCSPSRAMLLTGVDNHRTGLATIEEVLPPEHRGRPGYSLRLEPGVLTVADRLKGAGYRTLMTGKWHLGRGRGDLPDSHGFDRSLALDASGADNWSPKSYMPYYDKAPWFEDGKPTQLPESFYSSTYLVDRLIGYIDEDRSEAPYLAYLAFQAVHIPVQAPKAYADRYRGVFDDGWEVLREARWRRAQAMGLIPPGAPFTPLPTTLRPWASLSAEERRLSARSMEVYAGMLEAMDQEIGRLVAHIDKRGELDETVFVVTSDNGPEPSDPVHARGMNVWMALNGYRRSLDGLGERGSLNFIGPEWASALASPGSLYKFYASQGGLHVPLVVAGPGVLPGARVASNAYVSDVTPTLLSLAGVPAAAPRGAKPMAGRTLAPVLSGRADQTHGPADAVGFEVSGNAALFRGSLKLVRNMAPVGDGRWRLYDLSVDPGETKDLSTARRIDFASMVADYDAYAVDVGVLPLPDGYAVEQQVATNTIARQVERYGWAAAIIAAGAMALLVIVVRRLIFGRGRRRSQGSTA